MFGSPLRPFKLDGFFQCLHSRSRDGLRYQLPIHIENIVCLIKGIGDRKIPPLGIGFDVERSLLKRGKAQSIPS